MGRAIRGAGRQDNWGRDIRAGPSTAGRRAAGPRVRGYGSRETLGRCETSSSYRHRLPTGRISALLPECRVRMCRVPAPATDPLGGISPNVRHPLPAVVIESIHPPAPDALRQASRALPPADLDSAHPLVVLTAAGVISATTVGTVSRRRCPPRPCRGRPRYSSTCNSPARASGRRTWWE